MVESVSLSVCEREDTRQQAMRFWYPCIHTRRQPPVALGALDVAARQPHAQGHEGIGLQDPEEAGGVPGDGALELGPPDGEGREEVRDVHGGAGLPRSGRLLEEATGAGLV